MLPICAIILQMARKYPTASENRNLGKFTAERKMDLTKGTPIYARDLQGSLSSRTKQGALMYPPCVPHRTAVPTEDWLKQAIF